MMPFFFLQLYLLKILGDEQGVRGLESAIVYILKASF